MFVECPGTSYAQERTHTKKEGNLEDLLQSF